MILPDNLFKYPHCELRCHSLKRRTRLDATNYFLTNRVTEPWNAFPKHIVQAPTNYAEISKNNKDPCKAMYDI